MRKLMFFVLAVLICIPVLFGNPVWDGDGTYYFDSGTLVETAVSDNATLYVSGGEITSQLLCLDNSNLYMSGGSINAINVEDSSRANLMGGEIRYLAVWFPKEGLKINFFSESYNFDPDSYIGYDCLTGIWLNSGEQFEILLVEGTFPYLTFVPEPSTILLFGFSGVYVLRRRKKTTSI